jgi:sarcosine oxidase subunit delta
MFLIRCPWCGARDEAEFVYRGDATAQRPSDNATLDEFSAYVYARGNPRGWHLEWWHHAQGCRQFVKVLRHTLTHEICATAGAQETIKPPPA